MTMISCIFERWLNAIYTTITMKAGIPNTNEHKNELFHLEDNTLSGVFVIFR